MPKINAKITVEENSKQELLTQISDIIPQLEQILAKDGNNSYNGRPQNLLSDAKAILKAKKFQEDSTKKLVQDAQAFLEEHLQITFFEALV